MSSLCSKHPRKVRLIINTIMYIHTHTHTDRHTLCCLSKKGKYSVPHRGGENCEGENYKQELPNEK